MLCAALPEPITSARGDKKEEPLRMSNAEARGISKDTEKLVARIWREVDQGGEIVKEVKTFQIEKSLTAQQLCAVAGRRWGLKAEDLTVYEDTTPESNERFNDPDGKPTLDILDKLDNGESMFDKLMAGCNLYMKDAHTGQIMKIEPFDHNHFVDTKSKIKGRRKQMAEDKSYVQVQMEHDDLLFALWRPGGILVIAVDRTTTAKQVRNQILENMCSAVDEPEIQKRIRAYVHWWSIAEESVEGETSTLVGQKTEDRRLDWNDKVWPWRLGNRQESVLTYKMCFRYFVFSIKYPPPNAAIVDQPYHIKIRIKDPRNDYQLAEKYEGVLEAVVVDGKDHRMTIVDCDPTPEVGNFVCKFLPQKAGSYLAMVRFNGENIQNKWAKFQVSGEKSLTGLLAHGKKKQKTQFELDPTYCPDLGLDKDKEKAEKREKRRSRHSEKRSSAISNPIVKKTTYQHEEGEEGDLIAGDIRPTSPSYRNSPNPHRLSPAPGTSPSTSPSNLPRGTPSPVPRSVSPIPPATSPNNIPRAGSPGNTGTSPIQPLRKASLAGGDPNKKMQFVYKPPPSARDPPGASPSGGELAPPAYGDRRARSSTEGAAFFKQNKPIPPASPPLASTSSTTAPNQKPRRPSSQLGASDSADSSQQRIFRATSHSHHVVDLSQSDSSSSSSSKPKHRRPASQLTTTSVVHARNSTPSPTNSTNTDKDFEDMNKLLEEKKSWRKSTLGKLKPM